MFLIGVLMMTPIMMIAEKDDEDANDDKAEHPKSRRSREGRRAPIFPINL